MEIITEQNYNSNRRRAFRIYERVDLFFHKIDSHLESKEKHNFNKITNAAFQAKSAELINPHDSSSINLSLPDSEYKENDSLKVSISSSGISFTCKDELKKDDYLMIRVLLLSSMTSIRTCCKVVYCKPSNPYEKEQFPYTIGAKFINLTADDTELLNKYVKKKRTRQFIVRGLVASLITVSLVMPDVVFDLLLESFSLLIDNFLGAFYFLIELCEYGLEQAIEFLYKDDNRPAQITSFYVEFFFAILALFALIRFVPNLIVCLYTSFRNFCYRKKSSFFYYWGELTFLKKMGIISTAVVLSFCYSFFIF